MWTTSRSQRREPGRKLARANGYVPRLEALEERQLLTTLVALTDTNTLLTFDSSAPSAATSMTITGLLPGESLLDIAVRPATGQLYGLSFSHLYKIDSSTGAAAPVGDPKASLGLLGTQLAMSFDPVADQLRVVTAQVVNKVTQSEQNLALVPDTAQVASSGTAPQYTEGDLQFGRTPRLRQLAYTNQFAGATAATLYGIDDEPQVPDYLVTVGGKSGVPAPDQGPVFTVGSTGSWSSFTVGGPDNTAFALSQDDDSLWTVNLTNGTGTLVRPAAVSGVVIGLAALLPLSLPAVSINDVAVNECSSMMVDAVFTVTLSQPSSQAVTVQVQTHDGTAFAPQDYQPLAPTTLTFSPQQTTQTVTVKVDDNQLMGGVETFFVDLSMPSNVTIAKVQGRGTINNHPLVLPPPNESLVVNFYLAILGRQPDAAGQTYWQGLLDAGVARGFVAQSFLNSGEHATTQVEDLYSSLLGRQADPDGLQGFLEALAKGIPPDQVEATMLGSPEYMADHGGTPAGFLQGVYSDVLQRQIDPGGAAFWNKALANGELPAMVADQIVRSVEAVEKIVNAHYRRLLKRDADPVALNAWVTQIQISSSNLYGLDLTLANSLEFYDQIPPRQYQEFVTKLYHDLLGRAPDPGGFTHWTDQLDNGTDREHVVLGFVTSPEYRGRFITQGGIPNTSSGIDATDIRFADAMNNFSQTGLPGGGNLVDERANLFLVQDFGSGAGTQSFNFLVGLFADFLGEQVDPLNPPRGSTLETYEMALQNGASFQDIAYTVLERSDAGSRLATNYYSQFLGTTQPPDSQEPVHIRFPADGSPESTFTDIASEFNVGDGPSGMNRVLNSPEEIFMAALLGTNEYFARS